MAIILNIDTAVETASVCLAREGKVLGSALNEKMRDHASWLHPAMENVIKDAGLQLKDINAIAVSIGPGSYTGLRIGLAAVKGLCFALDVPLIPVGTLEMMANATLNENGDLLCPLIDARRMEVFTAMFDRNLNPIMEPCSMIIDSSSFDKALSKNKIIFSGNGAEKLKRVSQNSNAFFSTVNASANNMVDLSEKYYSKKQFGDTAYIEPKYIKEFYSIAR